MKQAQFNHWPSFVEEVVSLEHYLKGVEPIIKIPDHDLSNHITHIKQYISARGFTYPDHLIENFYLSLKSKPFVILAGVSGTGKTKLVELFAEAVGANKDNGQYTLIAVRPDWSDSTDLIGYQDLSGVFRPGKLTDVFVQALKPANRHRPYFVCLDEMNLARVEHYFSDLLSIMETRKLEDGMILTQPLITEQSLARDEDQQTYGGLIFPDNVFVIGTVNMDETTHPFSKKVLDRANTIEFNHINLSMFPEPTVDIVEPIPTSNNSFRSDYIQLINAYEPYSELIHKTTEKLVEINHILESIHSHVGFRIRDAICFYMIYNERFELLTEQEAFDLQCLQKILPRIQGSHLAVKKVLLQLLDICLVDKVDVEAYLDDATPFIEQWEKGKTPPAAHYPQSAHKLAFMLRRLEEDGFTSYWIT